MEFMNKLLPEVEERLLNGVGMERLIKEHTMYSFYGGFMKEEQKKKALETMKEGTGEYYKVIPMIKRNQARYLRLCPLCVREDRNKYGEAYWHTIHQMTGIDVCALHGCRLWDSSLQISADKSVKLITAEEVIDNDIKVSAGTDMEIKLAKYVAKVLQGIHNYPDKDIAEFLDQKLIGTKYLSKRGDHRYLAKLCEDFMDYYKDIKDLQPVSTLKTHLEWILKGKRIDLLEICMWAVFLGVSPEKLIKCEVLEENSRKRYTFNFDQKVLKLLNSGVGINEVSRRFGISSKTTRDILNDKFAGENARKRGQGGKVSRDWNTLDKELLPKVTALIEQVREETRERPKRITPSAIGKILNIPYKNFEYLPLCFNVLKQNTENYNEYWAREMVWAVKRITEEYGDINLTNIQKLTNLRKRNMISSVEYVKDKEYKKIIEGCLN